MAKETQKKKVENENKSPAEQAVEEMAEIIPIDKFIPNPLQQNMVPPTMTPQVKAVTESLGLPEDMDENVRGNLAQLTGGLSPASLALAYMDWAMHLASMPAKQQNLTKDAAEKWWMFSQYVMHQATGRQCRDCVIAEDKDTRFEGGAWQSFPFSAMAQGFLMTQDWWKQATRDVEGVSPHHADIVQFMTRQWLDMMAPTNFPATNPNVARVTMEQKGQNFVQGAQNLMENMRRYINKELPRGTEEFKVGENIATAKGKVVFRNDLFELIQYEPTTDRVHPEPVLMIPAWIMKYYILDLSEHNSMVRFLQDKGHTVFMISWKNPDQEDSDKGLNDYLIDGALKAVDVVSEIMPEKKINAVGYCVGGTLLAMAAAYLARKKDERLNSLTLFTTQLDFEEAGELMLFIDDSEIAYLEDLMKAQGYLRKDQMSGAFNMLRSKDLIWSQIVEQYLLGEEAEMFDLMAWNADATRLPTKMHSDYLRSLYLRNDLAENRYCVDDTLLSLQDINVPVFAVATRKDHIAPWESAYKINDLLRTETTFLLTNGGHNAGVISEPGHKGREYQMRVHSKNDPHIQPSKWREETDVQDGSWWPEWQTWLKNHSGNKGNPPQMGAKDKGYKPLEDAPGTYARAL